MKNAFTLIELIFTIVLLGLLSGVMLIGLFKYTETADKTIRLAEMNRNTQFSLEQISKLLSNRVSYSMIGYNQNTLDFESLYNVDIKFNIFEWIGVSEMCLEQKTFNGFVDLKNSNKNLNLLKSPSTNGTNLEKCLNDRWNKNNSIKDNIGIVFAGIFDYGELKDDLDYKNYYGWHGYDSKLVYDVESISNDGNIILTEKPNEIYEKIYLVDSSYAIARGTDIDLNSDCIKNIGLKSANDRAIFIFYNYRSWKNETFCADKNIINSELKAGEVSILVPNSNGFSVYLANDVPVFSLTVEDHIYDFDSNTTIKITKERTMF